MIRLTKPEFEPAGAWWVDDGFIPEALRGELLTLLPKRMNATVKADFLTSCAHEAQMLLEFKEIQLPPAATAKAELESVASKARSLLHALQALSSGTRSGFHAEFAYLAYGSSPPVELSQRSVDLREDFRGGMFLGGVWDLVSDLEAAAGYTMDRLKPSKQDRPGLRLARGLTRAIALAHRRITGEPPPYSKESWFPQFMAMLCDWEKLNFKCGPDLIESVIKEIEPLD